VVKEKKSDFGLALDGDGDRAIFCDHKGDLVDGDKVMAICATHLLEQGKLKQNTLVATVMSNLALEHSVQAAGGRVARTQVGDRYVAEEMARGGYNLGGEQSGHIIFGDLSVTGDGIISALQLLSIMVKKGKGLADLAQIMKPYPQVLVNVAVNKKEDWNKFPQIEAALKRGERLLKGRGRIMLRYSGTEPIARVLVEGEDAREIAQIGADIEQAIKECLS
jgi:phosphoglucosamine mutase